MTLAAGIAAIVPSAFADHMKVDVAMTQGSSTQGCEETKNCFDPSDVSVDVGGEVTWTNSDTASHTVTSGDLKTDPDNVGKVFDSSLIIAGKTFSFTFADAGTYNYFCQVHPWMAGIVTVEEHMAGEEGATGEEMKSGETYANAMSSDGSVKVAIEADTPKAGEEMSIKVTFTNADGSSVSHINYDITATQDGAEVLSESGVHEHEGV